MSYNLMAEGDLDLFELAQLSARFSPLELFPIPAEPTNRSERAGEVTLLPDALGIALPLSRVGPDAVAAARKLVELLWRRDAKVFDLHTGTRVETADDLDALAAELGD